MTLYALAISSNTVRRHWSQYARQQLVLLGDCQFSTVYQIPCRQGKGADYYNFAALLHSDLSFDCLSERLKQLEQHAGRVRPSHQIPLDIDIVAQGINLAHLELVASRLPLPFDAIKPLAELWPDCPPAEVSMPYQIVDL